jgi:hypothetical protein
VKIKRGSTSVRRLIFIGDTSKTDGSGLADLVHNSSGLVAYYFAGDLSNDVQITLATATLGTWTSGGFVAVDNTNMPGWYEIGIPDAALDGGNEVAIQLRGAANMAPVNIYIALDAVDYQDAAGFGLSRIDAAISSRMAAYTQPTGFLAATFPATVSSYAGGAVASVTGAVGSVTARVTANADQWGGVSVTGMPLPTASYTTPPTVGLIADAVWDEAYSGHTTAGTFGKLMDTLRKSNTVIEGTILASPTPTQTVFRISGADYPTGALEHAVLWMTSGANQEQNSPIVTTLNNNDGTLTITLEEALVTAPSAGDTVLIDPTNHVHAIADIQAGLATSANQTLILDRQGFALAVLAGTISDAQTAAETYAITISGSTYTVDFAGLDASGNRSGQTLVKT